MVLFIMLYMVVLTFKFVDETLECDYTNESYCAVLPPRNTCFQHVRRLFFSSGSLKFVHLKLVHFGM